MANFHLVSNKKERFSGWVSLYTLSKVGDPRAEGQAKLFRLSKWPLKQEHGIKISSWIALLCPWKDQKLYDITETNGSTLTVGIIENTAVFRALVNFRSSYHPPIPQCPSMSVIRACAHLSLSSAHLWLAQFRGIHLSMGPSCTRHPAGHPGMIKS